MNYSLSSFSAPWNYKKKKKKKLSSFVLLLNAFFIAIFWSVIYVSSTHLLLKSLIFCSHHYLILLIWNFTIGQLNALLVNIVEVIRFQSMFYYIVIFPNSFLIDQLNELLYLTYIPIRTNDRTISTFSAGFCLINCFFFRLLIFVSNWS